jgi:hypothetical protein
MKDAQGHFTLLQVLATSRSSPSVTFTEHAETKPVGKISSGNFGADVGAIERDLWSMSQDPLSGNFK